MGSGRKQIARFVVNRCPKTGVIVVNSFGHLPCICHKSESLVLSLLKPTSVFSVHYSNFISTLRSWLIFLSSLLYPHLSSQTRQRFRRHHIPFQLDRCQRSGSVTIGQQVLIVLPAFRINIRRRSLIHSKSLHSQINENRGSGLNPLFIAYFYELVIPLVDITAND